MRGRAHLRHGSKRTTRPQVSGQRACCERAKVLLSAPCGCCYFLSHPRFRKGSPVAPGHLVPLLSIGIGHGHNATWVSNPSSGVCSRSGLQGSVELRGPGFLPLLEIPSMCAYSESGRDTWVCSSHTGLWSSTQRWRARAAAPFRLAAPLAAPDSPVSLDKAR